MTPQLHFFVGKGGVGKSTTSALTALFLAASGRETLLVSMDPAHNQRDLFETEFSEKPRPVRERLAVKEIDTGYWIRTYLKQTREHLSKSYLYQSAFNLQDHFKVLQFSPGLEEYALLLAFENVLASGKGKDVVIFDMAPTALTLRFFSLPAITLTWLGELLKLRNEICRKKEIISKIRIGACELERDRVKNKLETLIEGHTRLRDLLMAQKPPGFWDQSECPCWVSSFNALDIASLTHTFRLFPVLRASIVTFLCSSGSTRTTNLPEKGFSGLSPRFAQKSK